METEIQPELPPVQPLPPIPPPVTPPTNLPKILLFSVLGLFVVAGLVFSGIQIGMKNRITTPQTVVVSNPIPTPDLKANWKTFSKNDWSFKYPPSLFAQESSEANFVDLVDNETVPGSNARVSIDARLISPYLNNYEAALKRRASDLNIIDPQITPIPNGIIISGKLGPGMGEGLMVTNGLIKYKTGAIAVEYNNSNMDPQTFRNILSTFKFTSWKTYENTKANISFKYPSDWELTFGESNHMVLFLKKQDPTQDKVNMPGDTQQNAEYNITIDLPPNEKISPPGKFEPITVDGISGTKFSQGAAPSSGPITTVQIIKDNSVYLLNYSAIAHPETHEKYLAIFDQILSTFKFVSTLSTDQRWTKISDSRYETINKCLWMDITKTTSPQNLNDYLKAYYQTSDLNSFLYQQQYQVAGYESKTISSQGIGELFSLYLKKDGQIYSFSFNSVVPEGGSNNFIDMCEKYPQENAINSAIDTLTGFF